MKRIIALIMAVCMVFGLAACGNTGGTNSGNISVINDVPAPQPRSGYALSEPAVPASAVFPNENDYFKNGDYDYESLNKAYNGWNEQVNEKMRLAEIYRGKLDAYLSLSSQYLKGRDGQNAVCSPVNIYFALAMLAECSQGNTRTEILNVLGAKDLNELRTVAKALWDQSYYDSGNIVAKLASSLWMNEEINGTKLQFNNDTLAALAMYYYATAYSGSAADKGFSSEFKEWLNDNTGGLLKDHIQAMDDFTDDLVLAIATTIYFKASWADKFEAGLTADDVFHAVSGDMTKPFMHATRTYQVCRGDGFTAVYLPFAAAGGMWIMLPDEGVSPEKMNEDGTIIGLVHDAAVYASGTGDSGEEIMSFDYTKVNVSLPKFDVDSELDLEGILKGMGIKDAFDQNRADLSGIISNVKAYVSSVSHAARVKIDEDGCEAAAYTVMMLKATGMFMDEPLEFKVDRPFAFAITGSDGLPLFTGIVNDPK